MRGYFCCCELTENNERKRERGDKKHVGLSEGLVINDQNNAYACLFLCVCVCVVRAINRKSM